MIQITTHRNIIITTETDTRGADYGESITVEWHGETCDFNTVAEARNWIDSELDTDYDHDPVLEWSSLGR